jgi:outer membrane protein TolC
VRCTALTLCALVLAPLARSGGIYPPLLPPEQQVMAALLAAPDLVAAHEQIGEGVANNRKLRAGPHEWEAAVITQQRKDAAGLQYREQEYELQRRFRLPGKGGLDRRMGALTAEAGELAYADSWHEAGRLLIAAWFDWQRAARIAALWQQQAETAAQQQQAVSKRVVVGDAPRLDRDQADAELGRVQALQLESLRLAEAARLALLEHFPGLDTTQPLTADLPDPPQIEEADEVWVKRIVAENHEIELAQARADSAQLLVRRAGLERMADPSLGLSYSKSIDGNIDLLRLRIAVPLGYETRDADVALARSAANRANAALMQARASVETAARTDLLNAHSSYRQWQRLAQVSRLSQTVADGVAKAYAAGEAGVGEVLLERRQYQEAQAQTLTALLTAHETYARLRLDAHEILALAEHQP